MKYLILSFTLTVSFFYNLNAQTNTICLVKYKDLKTKIVLGTHNYWFYQDKLISIKEPNQRAIYMRGFPVLINGTMTTQTDTTRYNQEFNEHINDMQASENKRPQKTTMTYYGSNISNTTYYDDSKNKKYIVIDSLKQMDNWEILSDTLTFMGYKCQKAVIRHNQKKYTAWFTTQLAYRAGPGIFYGLPGLILKVYNDVGDLGYEAIEIQTPYKGVVPKFDNEGEIVSHQVWLGILAERNRKMLESTQNMINEYKKQAATPKQ